MTDIRGASAHGVGARAAASGAARASADKEGQLDLPVLGKAPEFVDNEHWFNTPGDRPLTLKGLRGRVVLVDFWTYSCINCMRTLPYLNAWNAKYAQGRPDDRRRPHAGVPLRARGQQRQGSDRSQRHPLSRRPGQRTADLERLRQPVLAGRVLHRRRGQRPLRPLRRGRIRGERKGDPRAARRSRQEGAAEGRQGPRDRRLGGGDHPGDLPRPGAGRTLHQRRTLAGAARLHRPRRPAGERIRLPRALADRAAVGDGGRRLARSQLRRQARLPRARLAGQGPQGEGEARRQADFRRRRRHRRPRRRRRRRPRSASTTSSTCRRSNTTSSNWNRKRA